MPFKPGVSGNPAGRPKGRTDTEDIRTAYRKLIEGNIDNLNGWIDEIAKENPFRAVDLLIKLSGYVLPKLQSVEVFDQFERLTDEDINMLSEKLIKKLKSNEKPKRSANRRVRANN